MKPFQIALVVEIQLINVSLLLYISIYIVWSIFCGLVWESETERLEIDCLFVGLQTGWTVLPLGILRFVRIFNYWV